jgi:hypothetical protein
MAMMIATAQATRNARMTKVPSADKNFATWPSLNDNTLLYFSVVVAKIGAPASKASVATDRDGSLA